MLNFKVKQNLKNLHKTNTNIAILKRNNFNFSKEFKMQQFVWSWGFTIILIMIMEKVGFITGTC